MRTPKKPMGITRAETKQEQIIRVRNEIIVDLFNAGFSYGEIQQIANIDKGGASRIVRFGRNTSKPVTQA